MIEIEALLARLERVKQRGDRWDARCPAHDDSEPSLTVMIGEKGLMFKCHVGCSTEDIMRALGLGWADMWLEGPAQGGDTRPHILATYDYCDAQGRLLMQVVRMTPKAFRQRRPKPGGGWIWNLGDTPRVLYRLPELLAADPGSTVWVVEGEKDVETARGLGLVATTFLGGAGKLDHTPEGPALLARFARVVVIADDDSPGRAHALELCARILEAGGNARVGLPAKGKDLSEHVHTHGLGIRQIRPLDPELPAAAPSGGRLPLLVRAAAPELPLECLPVWVQIQVTSVAETIRVPADAAAQMAIGALSTVLTLGRAQVQVVGGHIQGCNLYLAMVMGPGSGKSPIIRSMFGPVRDLGAQWVKISVEARHRQAAQAKIWKKEMGAAEAAGDIDTLAYLMGRVAEAEADSQEPIPLATDVTTEGLVLALERNRGVAALVSDEGGMIDGLGRHLDRGKAVNLDPVLQGWSGDDVTVVRASKPTTHIRGARVSMAIGVQPELWARLVGTPEYAGRGLIDRIHGVMPPSMAGEREFRDIPSRDPRVAEAWALGLGALGQRHPWGADLAPIPYVLSSEASQEWAEWRDAIERRRGPAGDLGDLEGAPDKLTSSAVRVAAILHAANGGTPAAPISGQVMRDAQVVADWWLGHLLAQAPTSSDREQRAAAAIGAWLPEPGVEVTLRDIQRSGVVRRLFPQRADLLGPVGWLVERGWLLPDIDDWEYPRAHPRFQVLP